MNTEKRYDFNSTIDFNGSVAKTEDESRFRLKLDVKNPSDLISLSQNRYQQSSGHEQLESKNLHKNKSSAGKVINIGTIRFAAMSYLAAREHSQKELVQKLSRRFDDEALVEQAVQQLSDESLQCDDRFAEAFTAMRKRKGQGPIRIAYELQQKGISPDLVEIYVYDTSEEEWLEHAKDVCQKKYGDMSNSHTLRAKQMRFLQYRGFSSDTIRALWR
ncbi:MAG: recombination regulator RecX [Cellvibrionaceae bacterium]